MTLEAAVMAQEEVSAQCMVHSVWCAVYGAQCIVPSVLHGRVPESFALQIRKLENDLTDALAELVVSREEQMVARSSSKSAAQQQQPSSRLLDELQEQLAGARLEQTEMERQLRSMRVDLQQAKVCAWCMRWPE